MLKAALVSFGLCKAYGCDLVIKNKVSCKQVPGEVFDCSGMGLQLILTKEHFKTIRRQ